MELRILETVGKIAGIAGLSLGTFLLLFREVIRRNIFPKLTPDKAYSLIQQFMYLTFSIAALGLFAWVYVSTTSAARPISGGIDAEKPSSPKKLTLSGTVTDAKTNNPIGQAEIAVVGAGVPAVSDDNGNFHLDLDGIIPANPTPVHMRVSKHGYRTLDWQVTPPAKEIIVPLTPSQ